MTVSSIVYLRDLYLRFLKGCLSRPVLDRFIIAYDYCLDELKDFDESPLKKFQEYYLSAYLESIVKPGTAYRESLWLREKIKDPEGVDNVIILLNKLNFSVMSGLHPLDKDFKKKFQKQIESFGVTDYYKELFLETSKIVYKNVALINRESSSARCMNNRNKLQEIIENNVIEKSFFNLIPISQTAKSVMDIINIENMNNDNKSKNNEKTSSSNTIYTEDRINEENQENKEDYFDEEYNPPTYEGYKVLEGENNLNEKNNQNINPENTNPIYYNQDIKPEENDNTYQNQHLKPENPPETNNQINQNIDEKNTLKQQIIDNENGREYIEPDEQQFDNDGYEEEYNNIEPYEKIVERYENE